MCIRDSPPIFEMNLPEGALRERLRLAFAKATGTFDDFDLLAIVGRSQVGRIRYTGDKERLNEDVPFQSVAEILASRRDGDLFRYLIEKFAAFSGISGVQPKILVRDENASLIPVSYTHLDVYKRQVWEDLSSPWCMVSRGKPETWTYCKSHRGMLADLCWNSVCRAVR